MKLDHSYILPSLMALMVHIVVAFIVMTEWQSQSKRTPPVQIKQRVEATLIDLDSLLAQQKQVVSAADKKAADKKVIDAITNLTRQNPTYKDSLEKLIRELLRIRGTFFIKD